MWNISLYETAGTTTGAGIFIPVADLHGLTVAELGDANAERKVAYGICSRLVAYLSENSALGLTASRSSATVQQADRLNQTFTFTSTFWAKHSNNSLSNLPLPAGNAGAITMSAIFPGALFIAANNAVPAGGILVRNDLVAPYGAILSSMDDTRSWLVGLILSMISQMDESTAVVNKSIGQAVGIFPGSNFTGTGAVTGLEANDLSVSSFFTKQYTIGFQLALNMVNQTFDLAA